MEARRRSPTSRLTRGLAVVQLKSMIARKRFRLGEYRRILGDDATSRAAGR
jgi:hypothetical protein